MRKTALHTLISYSQDLLVDELWQSDPRILGILQSSDSIDETRRSLHNYLNKRERRLFDISSHAYPQNLHIFQRTIAKECLRVMKNIVRTENEELTGFSALKLMKSLSAGGSSVTEDCRGLVLDLIFLFRGINGTAELYDVTAALDSPGPDVNPSVHRSLQLDLYSDAITAHYGRYRSGLDPGVEDERQRRIEKILRHFGAGRNEWGSWQWHLSHIIRDAGTLEAMVRLDDEERRGLDEAARRGIPFQITPHYLSLFNPGGRDAWDRGVRAQVLPTAQYVLDVWENRRHNIDMDFMEEKSTSPIENVTRRYPKIVILKPFESCPQLCVYCQRNWEVKDIDSATTTPESVRTAIRWIGENRSISEVLVTGGDPLTLDNQYMEWIISELAGFEHIERIRIGTRIPVTMPQRIDDGLIAMLRKYHRWGRREICIVTHFEHAVEITADTLAAIESIKNAGMNVYNQQVFTYYNSRKFETCFLRTHLKRAGIDPYYSFNTKGKLETQAFRVPIARIEQERKEEARQLSGLSRTDEPVFNVPRLGKTHLRSWQDHEPIMIMPNGCRVYRFFPWESRLQLTDEFIYTDVSIYEYLLRLAADGEDVNEYRSIWYYF